MLQAGPFSAKAVFSLCHGIWPGQGILGNYTHSTFEGASLGKKTVPGPIFSGFKVEYKSFELSPVDII